MAMHKINIVRDSVVIGGFRGKVSMLPKKPRVARQLLPPGLTSVKLDFGPQQGAHRRSPELRLEFQTGQV